MLELYHGEKICAKRMPCGVCDVDKNRKNTLWQINWHGTRAGFERSLGVSFLRKRRRKRSSFARLYCRTLIPTLALTLSERASSYASLEPARTITLCVPQPDGVYLLRSSWFIARGGSGWHSHCRCGCGAVVENSFSTTATEAQRHEHGVRTNRLGCFYGFCFLNRKETTP